MGLFDWLFKRAGASSAAPSAYQSATTSKWTQPPRYTANQYLELFHTSPRLDTLRNIAEDVAGAEWGIYDKRQLRNDPSAQPLKASPLYELLENPMPEKRTMDGFILKYLTVVYLRLTGDAFWLIERNGRGEPAELYPIPPTWVIGTPTAYNPTFLVTPFGVSGGATVSVREVDMVWFKDPNVLDPFGRGRGREESIGDEMQSDEYAAKYSKNLFANDATPPWIVTAPGIDKAGAERFMENWMARYSGYGNAHKPGVIGFDAKFQKLTDSAREMDFTESRKLLRDFCLQHFSVPPEMQGILENSNRSTIDSAYYLYHKNVLSRAFRQLEHPITRQLCPEFDANCCFKFTCEAKEDETFVLTRATQGLQARAITINEWRKANGWDAIDGGDELPKEPTPTVAPNPGKEDEEGQDEEPADEDDTPKPPKKSFSKSLKAIDKAVYWADFDKTAKAEEANFQQTMGRVAQKQHAALRAAYKAAKDSGLSMEAALDKALSDVYGAEADKALAEGLAPDWAAAMKSGFQMAERVLGGGLSFDIVQPAFQDWIKENGYAKGKLINETSVGELRDTIQEGINAGEGIRKISQRIAEKFADLEGYRAEAIARTETAASVNFGQLETYAREGVKRKEWLSTFDGKARPEHENANAQVVDIDQPFDIGGEMLMFPGDANGSAENVINCRCTILPVED